MSNSLWRHGPLHARLLCPSQPPGVCSNSSPLECRWCHPTLSSSVVPFSSHLQSFPASGSFPMTQFFSSCGQSIGVSALASVLPMVIWDWFPLGLIGWISLQSRGFSKVFSNTIVQKHQFFGIQLSLSYNPHIQTSQWMSISAFCVFRPKTLKTYSPTQNFHTKANCCGPRCKIYLKSDYFSALLLLPP